MNAMPGIGVFSFSGIDILKGWNFEKHKKVKKTLFFSVWAPDFVLVYKYETYFFSCSKHEKFFCIIKLSLFESFGPIQSKEKLILTNR